MKQIYLTEIQIGTVTETEGYTETAEFSNENEMKEYIQNFINQISSNPEKEYKIFITKK